MKLRYCSRSMVLFFVCIVFMTGIPGISVRPLVAESESQCVLVGGTKDATVKVRQHEIERHKKLIATQVGRLEKVSYIVQSAVIGAAIGGLLYGSYIVGDIGIRLISGLFQSNKGSSPDVGASVLQDDASWRQGIPVIQALAKQVAVLETSVKNLGDIEGTKREVEAIAGSVRDQSWIKSMSLQVVHMAAMSALSAVCVPYVEKMLFKNELIWFMEHKTRFNHVVDQLKNSAATIDDHRALPEYKVHYASIGLRATLHELVSQVEKIIGFMEHLHGQATARRLIIPDDLLDAPYFIQRITNDFCQKMSSLLELHSNGVENILVMPEVNRFTQDTKNVIELYRYFDARLLEAQDEAVIEVL